MSKKEGDYNVMGESTTRLRAGVVGLGLGAAHAQAYASHSQVTLVAVCDENAERLANVVSAFPSVKAYTGLHDMLERERLDLVSICTPDWLHADMCIAALQAGAHVICTKPVTTNIDDARRLIAAADATRRSLMVAHDRRFAPRYRAIKDVLEQGLLGTLFYIELDYFDHKERQFAKTPWYRSAEHPRAAILGTGSHAVDLMRWFGGEVEEAWGAGNHLAYPDFPEDDCMIGIFRLSGGTIGKVTQTYASIRGAGEPDMRVTIHGTAGSIEDDKLIYLGMYDNVAAMDLAGQKPWGRMPLRQQSQSSHQAQIEYFISCVLAGRPAEPDGRDAARTVAACLAAVEAARTGQSTRPALF